MKEIKNFCIKLAKTEDDIIQTQSLIRQFVKWHYTRHAEYKFLLDSYFDEKEFEEGLSNISRDFSGKNGKIFLAKADNNYVGCILLKHMTKESCEMKRLFVTPAYHGCGIGTALVKFFLNEAKHLEYKEVFLDTGPNSKEAQKIYENLGFNKIAPYYDLDEKMSNWLIFMKLTFE